MRVKRWITNNIGLKIISLVLAIVTWFYISLELEKIKSEEEQSIINMLNYEVVSKKLPVQLTIVGEARENCKVVMDKVIIEPATIIVIGPDSILSKVNFVRTVPVDISEYTQDVVREVELAPIAEGLNLKHGLVRVRIPIVKEQKEE